MRTRHPKIWATPASRNFLKRGGRREGIGTAVKLRTIITAPILFVTSHANAKARARILQGVPDAVILRKPIVPEDLRRNILSLAAGNRPN